MHPTLVRHVPDTATRDRIRALADRIEAQDGAPPLSDQTRASLGSDTVEHLVVVVVAAGDGAAEVIGYGQVADGSLEVAADTGATPLILDAARFERVWSHGTHSRLVGELERRGLRRVRELHQLRRPLDAAHPLPDDPPLADGVTVRTFEPGRDDAAWLALNAAAFAHHPEQGRMTQTDLDARLAEPWFDAAGFLLAERDGELVAFHWTKVHPDGLGEVYVLGVAPSAQGLGLGGALLTRGLRLLRDRGCPAVLLYVDGDNPTAVHLYERDGFERFDLDVQWERD